MLERPKSYIKMPNLRGTARSENTHDRRALDDRWPLIVRWTFDSQRTPTVRRTGIHKRPLEVGRVLKLLLPLVTSLVCSFPWQLRARAAITGDLTFSLSRSPSLQVCARGRQHIYKFLEMKAVRGEQEERLRRGASDELELRSARPPPVGGNDVMSPQPRPAAPPPPAAAAAAAAGPESRGSVVGQRGSHAPPPHDPAGYSGGLDWTETQAGGGGGGIGVVTDCGRVSVVRQFWGIELH